MPAIAVLRRLPSGCDKCFFGAYFEGRNRCFLYYINGMEYKYGSDEPSYKRRKDCPLKYIKEFNDTEGI